MYIDFNVVCDYRATTPGTTGNSVPSNDPSISHVIESLENIANQLKMRFQNYRGVELKFIPSKGAAVFPFVPYVAILPPGQSVSKGIYVVICFDKFGRGALVGCAESKTNSQGLETVKRTVKGLKLGIDVNGPKSNTHYNDVFSQPREFIAPLTTDETLLAHIEESLERALIELGIIEEAVHINRVKNEREATVENFNLLEIKDAREKVTQEINARRGQKKFRERLLAEYGQCVVSGCGVLEALEAAHIFPYKGENTNTVANGLLLRSDIHTLFDLGFISITPDTNKIRTSQSLRSSEYEKYEGIQAKVPVASEEALAFHYQEIFKG